MKINNDIMVWMKELRSDRNFRGVGGKLIRCYVFLYDKQKIWHTLRAKTIHGIGLTQK